MSLILVSDFKAEAENATALRDWIRIFQRVLGDLNDMNVKFMIQHVEFLKFEVNRKSAVHRIDNGNLR